MKWQIHKKPHEWIEEKNELSGPDSKKERKEKKTRGKPAKGKPGQWGKIYRKGNQ